MEDGLNSLINKYLDGKLNSPERVKLESWLNHVHFSKEVVPDWSDEDKDNTWKVILERTRGHEVAIGEQYVSRDQKIWLPLLWVAATIGVLLFTVSLVVEWNKTITTLTASRTGKVVLPDGTLVWLRDNSTLTYPSSFDPDKREVSISGEALFEVVRSPASPFLIRCGEYTAKVLGTSFSIRSTPNDVEVIVLTGTVSIGPTNENVDAVTVLHQNERVVFNRAVPVLMPTKVDDAQRSKAVAHTGYEMRFEDTTMATVIGRIQNKFDVSIVLQNPAITLCKISADFTDQPLDATLRMMCEALDLTYAVDGSQITLSGAGCVK